MIALQAMLARTRPLMERLDALTLRERVIIFGAGVTLIYLAWQTLLMDPLAARSKSAEQQLANVRQQATVIDQIGTASSQDPAVAAALRNRALGERLSALDREINSAAQGYVAPQRMNELLRALLAEQHGLRLVSLKNLPVESLSRPEGAKVDGKVDGKVEGKADTSIAAGDRGPFLHPVEIVVEGDYASVVAYLRAVESLPWRIHWRELDLVAGEYPLNRVTLVIGALSLSPDWMSV
jgi:MSHA biogenesis protein MshJ